MADVHDAITEIMQALDAYGSDITLIKVVQGVYDPLNGSTTTETEIPLKTLINKSATAELSRRLQGNTTVNSYEYALMFYHTETPDTSWKVRYNGSDYKITLVSTYTLQNTIFKYEVLIQQ